MDLPEKIKRIRTMRERIQELFISCGDGSDKITKISEIAGFHRTTIARYINGEESIRLKNVGRLIMAIKIYLRDYENNHELTDAITIENMSYGLAPEEYRKTLKVKNEQALIKLMSEKIIQPIDPSKFENVAYAYNIIQKWENKKAGEKYLKDVYIPQTLKNDNSIIDNVLDSWMKDEKTPSFFLLLGDIGIGKTTSLLSFAARQAKIYAENPTVEPLPIYIDLSNYRKIEDIEILIKNLIFDHFKDQILNVDQLLELVKNGRLVFVLDGFDEMATRLTHESLFDHLNQIDKLYHVNGKLVLSSRKQVFSSQDDFYKLFEKTKIGKNLFNHNGMLKELNAFTKNDVQNYLKKIFGEDYHQFSAKLETLPGFFEMSCHPMMLEMMVQIIPYLEDVKSLTKADLFTIYFNKWCTSKNDRRIINTDHLKKFCQELAGTIWQLDQHSITYSRLKDKVKRYFDPDDPKEFENLTMAITNDSFLTRNGDKWKFMHEAFFQFFLALAVMNSKSSNRIIENKKLPKDVLDFLKDLPLDSGDLINRLRSYKSTNEANQKSTDKNAMQNIMLILRAKNYHSHLWDSISPELSKKITTYNGLLEISKQTLPLLDLNRNIMLTDIVEKYIFSRLELIAFHGISNKQAYELLLKFSEFQNKIMPGESNPACSLDAFLNAMFPKKEVLAENEFLRHCNELIFPEDFSNSSTSIKFSHDFFSHYFLAQSWKKCINQKAYKGMGAAPVQKETLDWFFEIVPESDLEMEVYDFDMSSEAGVIYDPSKEALFPGSVSKILMDWIVSSKDKKWRTEAGLYMGSICLSIISRTKLKLSSLSLSGGYYPGSYLVNTDLKKLDLSNSHFNNSIFDKSDMTEGKFNEGTFTGGSFQETTLTKATLCGADLSYSTFTNAYLREADMTRCNLTKSNFTGANYIERLILDQAILHDTKGL